MSICCGVGFRISSPAGVCYDFIKQPTTKSHKFTKSECATVREYTHSTQYHIKTTKPLGSHMRVHNPRKQVFAWIVPKPSLICRRIGKQRAKDMFFKGRITLMTVKQVHLMSAFLHFVFLFKKNLFHRTYKRITVRRFETHRANNSDVCSQRGKKTKNSELVHVWGSEQQRHDCVRTLPRTTSSSEAQRHHSQLYWCLSLSLTCE